MTESQKENFRNAYCGFIFQEYNLLPELTVGENIALPLEIKGEQDTKKRVKEILSQVDLSGYETRNITELSGGQKQRVAIARALIKEPQIIFADEPTGALDSTTGESIMQLMKGISKDKLVVVITHEREFAEKYGDRIIELADGKIVDDKVINTPAASKDANLQTAKSKVKLPFKTTFKLGGSNLRYHPVRLIVTILICIISFTVFGISWSYVTADRTYTASKAMVDVGLTETLCTKRDNATRFPISNEDYYNITEKYNLSALRTLTTELIVDDINYDNLPTYYKVKPRGFCYSSEAELAKFNLSFVGTYPTADNQIMLTGYLAEQLFYATNSGEYSASSMLNRKVSIDGEQFIITAILEDNLQNANYLSLKDTDKFTNENSTLFYNLRNRINSSYHNLIFLYDNPNGEFSAYSELVININGMSQKDLANLLKIYEDGYTYSMSNFVIDEVNSVYENVESITRIVFILAIIFCVFAVVMLIYFISQSVEDKYTTIAILRTLGLSNKQILKIFIWEGLLIGIFVFLFTLLATVIGCTALNSMLGISTFGVLQLFRIKFADIIISFACIFASSLIGGVVPIGKINKSKELDFMES
jgi:energy-coupling factor transporter ATP-binding protein EcfA2/ABC-type antimicrobial peptide transport system permease subunit